MKHVAGETSFKNLHTGPLKPGEHLEQTCLFTLYRTVHYFFDIFLLLLARVKSSKSVAPQPWAHLSWSVSNWHLCSHAEILWRWGRWYWEQEACSLQMWDSTSNSCQGRTEGQRWSLRGRTGVQVHHRLEHDVSVFILSSGLLLQNDKTIRTTSHCKMSVWKCATDWRTLLLFSKLMSPPCQRGPEIQCHISCQHIHTAVAFQRSALLQFFYYSS